LTFSPCRLLQITRKVACRLSPLQRQLYVDILARNFEALNGRAKGSAKNSLNNVLMNLRKACDHPFLFEVRSMTCAQVLVIVQCASRDVHGQRCS
jgi:SNF2 family DNA or RNA helicase